MKTYRDILGLVIEVKKDYQWLSKGERWLVISRESTDNSLKYELQLIDSPIPIRHLWFPDELLIKLIKERYIKL